MREIYNRKRERGSGGRDSDGDMVVLKLASLNGRPLDSCQKRLFLGPFDMKFDFEIGPQDHNDLFVHAAL